MRAAVLRRLPKIGLEADALQRCRRAGHQYPLLMPTRELPYVDPEARRSLVYRAYARLVGTRAMGWFSRKVAWKLDPLLLRLSGGRLGMGLVLPTALLETRGARTGRVRRNGVIYFHDGKRATIIASQLGLPQHPAWFHNLRVHPDVKLGGQRFHAEVIDDELERARLWQLADRVFPPYAAYRKRAGRAGRTIPIVQLILSSDVRANPPSSLHQGSGHRAS